MRGPVGIVDVRRRLGEAGDVVIGGGWGGGEGDGQAELDA